MAWTWNQINNAPPATHVRPTQARYAHFFYDNEAVTFSWTQGTEAGLWWLRNYYGTQVASGTVSGTSIDLGILPLGWYKLYFGHSNPNIGTPLWGNARGEIMFGVVRSSMSLRNTAVPINAPGGWEGALIPSKPLTGMGQYRMDIDLDSVHPGWYSGSLSTAQQMCGVMDTYAHVDAARPMPRLAQFPEGTGGPTPSGTDNSQIQGAVSSLYGLGVSYFEARNEPNTGSYTGAGYTSELQAFYNNVKAGNASAQVVGGCSVNLTDAYIGTILAAGAGQYMDVMSVHAYNGTNGNIAAGRESWDHFIATLARYSFTKPLWMTEYGSLSFVYGSFEPRLQAQWMTLDIHLAEQHGIPKERYMWFYDANIGFWDFPSFMWCNDYSTIMPNASPVIMRVWSEEVYGKTYASRLNFGQADHEFIGSRFVAGNGTATAVLQSGGGFEDVEFDVTGASSLTLVSTFGNTSTLTVTGGRVTVPMTPEPCYVRLPAGATFTPSATEFGVEVVRAQFSQPTASSVASDSGGLPVVVDGLYSNGEYTIGPEPYRADTTDNGPSWFRLSFPRPTRLDRVHIACPHPWQHDSSLLAFEVQYLDDDLSTWLTAGSFAETAAADLTFKWSSHMIAGQCFSDSFWSRRHIFRLPLAQAVETTAIRVYATNMSYGGGAVAGVATGFGEVDYDGNPVTNGQTGAKRMSFLEISAYLSGETDGGTAVSGQPMLLLQP